MQSSVSGPESTDDDPPVAPDPSREKPAEEHTLAPHDLPVAD